ncbi:MAG TPA: hypothetical protein VGE04_19390 [Chloroflexia bacterium]|jgi:hypothetical protein
MTELLQKAIAEVNKLPPEQQDELAALMLEELSSEQRWESAFADTSEALTRLADEALVEHRTGKTGAKQ